MFSSDEKIAELTHLVREVREYVDLRLELARYDLTAKAIQLLSALCLGVIVLMVVAVAFLFLSFSLVQALHEWLHNESAAYLIVGGAYLVIAAMVYLLRRSLIYQPMARFIGHLFLKKDNQPTASGNAETTNDWRE